MTVAQFRTFVDATQFEINNADALRDPDGRPVRYMSWHDAMKYCNWLNEMLATVPALEHSAAAQLVRKHRWRISLPSELEWEKATRGGLLGCIFPWGDTADSNRTNYSESDIGDTSAVGCFPANGYGLYDTVGNIWEWTRSLWGKDLMNPDFAYPYDSNDKKREDLSAGDDNYRVVRGGAFHLDRGSARCACRGRLPPDFRGDDLGFRVVLRSPPRSSRPQHHDGLMDI